MSRKLTESISQLSGCCITAATFFAISGCGSTVQWSQQRDFHDAISQPGNGLIVNSQDSIGKAPNNGTSSRNPPTMNENSQLGTIPGTAAGMNNTNGETYQSATKASPIAGVGFTSNEIFIGYDYPKDAEEFAASLGFSANFGNHVEQMEIVAKDINNRGGIAGRTVSLVPYGYETSELASNPSGAAQRACSRWTEDRPVFAAITITGFFGDQILSRCLAQRRTPQIAQSLIVRPKTEYIRNHPYLYSPSWAPNERISRSWITRLNALGYFDGGWKTDRNSTVVAPTKIGLWSTRPAYGAEFRESVEREVARHGLIVTEEAEWSGNASTATQEAQSAILKFREAGVTHILTHIAGSTAIFMTTAESQGYRPRYAVQSNMNPASLQNNVPRAQLRGAVGAGHMPSLDVDTEHSPKIVSDAETHCKNIMENGGQDTSNRDAWRLMASRCDAFEFLMKAVDRGGLSALGLSKGAAVISRMPSASTFRISFSSNEATGASAVRDLAFSENCGCFRYESDRNHGM